MLVVIMMVTAVPLAGISANAAYVTPGQTRGFTLKNYHQYDSPWGSKKINRSTLAASACGVLSTVNAVYNLTGNFIDPYELAKDTHNAGLFNMASPPDKGGGVATRKFFPYISDNYGNKYGFKIDSGSNKLGIDGNVKSSKLVNHLKSGGTAIVHVTNHFMAIVDYNEQTEKYLVFDPYPGDHSGSGRSGLTTKNGDWKTAKQLMAGNKITVDRFWLVSKKGTISYSITANNAPNVSNNTATISSEISPTAKVQKWGYFIGTKESEVKNVNGTDGNTHEDTKTMDWHRFINDDNNPQLRSSASYTVTNMFDSKKALQPDTTYYYKFCVKVNDRWYQSGVKSFKTTKSKPDATTLTVAKEYSDIGLNKSGVTASWKAAKGAEKYSLQLLNSSGQAISGKIITDLYGTTATCPSSWFSEVGIYSVRLTAINSMGSTYSNTQQIEVHPNVRVTFYDTITQSIISQQDIPYGESADTPQIPNQKGYTFKQWSGSYTNVTSDVTINAEYTPKVYTVKFIDSLTGDIIDQPVKVEYGKPATAPTVESRGSYIFTGWDKDFSCIEEDTVVTANYKWFDDDFPVSLNITENPRQDKKTEDGLDITGYYVKFSVEAWDKSSVQGRVIVALKSESGLLLTSTESEAFSVKPGTSNKQTMEVFVPYSKLAYRASVYAVNEYDRNGIISDVNSRTGATVNYTIDNSNSWLETTDRSQIPEGAEEGESYEAPNYTTQTLYRYRDKETTTSYDTSIGGWTRDGDGEWINQGQQTLEYVPSFHSGFDTGNSLYKKYNKSPVSAYENATEKLVIDHTDHKSYIYWHWCEGKTASSPGNHYIAWNKSTTYKKFHAFESTTKKEYKGTDYNAYVYKKSDCCSYNYNWNGRSSKQDKLTEVKKQYYTIYRKRFNYYRWTDWSSWSTTPVSASSTREVETKQETVVSDYTTVYRYRMPSLNEDPVIDTETQVVNINGKVDAKYIGKRGFIVVYKNTQASDFTNEFINGVVIESATDENGNEYGSVVFNGAKLKEAPSTVTGDFTIAVAIAGNSESIKIGTIKVRPEDKPKYTVRYLDFNGNVIHTYKDVTEGSTVEEPDGKDLTAPEGYRFVRWNTSAVNVQRDLEIKPMSEKESYAVVYVDWASQNVILERHQYGDQFALPPFEEQDGKIVSWDTKDLRVVADDNPDVVHYTAYKDAIVTTKYEDAIYDARFIKIESPIVPDMPDPPADEPENDEPEDVHNESGDSNISNVDPNQVKDEDLVDKKRVPGGVSIELPYEDEELDQYIFKGWRNITTGKVFDGNDIKEDGTYYPVYEFADTVETPVASVTTGEYNTNQTVMLSCETETAVIYYSTDGTNPETGEVNQNDNDPSGIHKYTGPITLTKPTNLQFCAMAMGMNNSGTVAELYAINTAASGVKYHLVTVYSNLPQNEGASYQALIKDSTRFKASEFGAVEGYVYEGLFFDAEGEDEFVPSSDLITEETTLYAIYTPKKYTATFKDYDGTQLSTSTVDYGTSAETPTPSRDGYVFIGWDSDDYEYITGNKTFTAQYCLESEYARVSLNKSTLARQEGDGAKLKVTVTPAELSDTELIWETNNAEVATVDQNGVVECLSEGSATITVTVAATGESSECFVTVLPNADKTLFLVDGSQLDIDAQRYLRRIPANANTVGEIRESFANDESKLSFFGMNSVALADTDLVGTGSVVKLMDGETVLDQITAIMTGDFDGNGKVQNRDVSMMAQNVINTRDASEVQAIAVDVNGDGDVNVRDCAMVSRYLVGKEELE